MCLKGGDMLEVMNVEYAPERPVSLVRVLVVDDFVLWRGYIIARLEEQPDLQIAGFASDGLQAVQKAQELQPDLILLDISLPKLNGLEAARQIRRLAPRSKILFLSGESHPDIVGAAFWAGGSGFVSKMDAAEELLTSIEAILNGKQFVSPSLMDRYELTEAMDSDFKDKKSAL
jgi:DNA-binding NarL/FixJ family response regulator